jgi:hypothetical protein
MKLIKSLVCTICLFAYISCYAQQTNYSDAYLDPVFIDNLKSAKLVTDILYKENGHYSNCCIIKKTKIHLKKLNGGHSKSYKSSSVTLSEKQLKLLKKARKGHWLFVEIDYTFNNVNTAQQHETITASYMFIVKK